MITPADSTTRTASNSHAGMDGNIGSEEKNAFAATYVTKGRSARDPIFSEREGGWSQENKNGLLRQETALSES